MKYIKAILICLRNRVNPFGKSSGNNLDRIRDMSDRDKIKLLDISGNNPILKEILYGSNR